jgi:phosphatidate cytidylyltransferase
MKRVLTALVGIPLVILANLFSPDWLFALLIAIFAALCFEEFLTIGAARVGVRPGRWVVVLGAFVTTSFIGGASWVLSILTISLLAAITAITLRSPLESNLPELGLTGLGLLYCCVLLGFMVLLPREAVFVLFGIIWAGDSAAYYTGRLIGRHKLAPHISPNKTVEGAVGGLAASIIAGVLIGRWLLGEETSTLVAASLLTAIAGQIGDLAESAFKRSAGVKDSSALLPGHGGILDRLDSLLFAAPVFYLFFKL